MQESASRWFYYTMNIVLIAFWSNSKIVQCSVLTQIKREAQKIKKSVNIKLIKKKPVPVAAQSNASVCGRWLAGTVGSNTAGDMDVCLL